MAVNERQLMAIELMTSGGMKKGLVAKELGVDNSTISRWFRDPDFANEYQKSMSAYIQSLSQLAMKTYTDLLENAQSEAVKAAVAKDIMSRSGYDATAKTEVLQRNIIVSIINEETNEEPEHDQHQVEEGDIQSDIPTLFDTV